MKNIIVVKNISVVNNILVIKLCKKRKTSVYMLSTSVYIVRVQHFEKTVQGLSRPRYVVDNRCPMDNATDMGVDSFYSNI